MTNPLTEAKKALDEATAALHAHQCPSQTKCDTCFALERVFFPAHRRYKQLFNDEDKK